MIDPVPLQLNGEGNYVLTDIKNIEVTEEFVGLGRTVTRCQTEEFRLDCQARRQKEKVLSRCRCAPYTLRSHYGEAVPICSAAALDCVRRVALSKGRLQKFLLKRLVEFSIKWVGGVLLVH